MTTVVAMTVEIASVFPDHDHAALRAWPASAATLSSGAHVTPPSRVRSGASPPRITSIVSESLITRWLKPLAGCSG